MTGLVFFLMFVALLVASGVVAARDMRPNKRPPEWSVGSLIAPRS